MEDRQLLLEYVHRGSESAFRTLVERHLGLVHSAALRQVNNRALAEEVCQAVFVVLARKASRLSRQAVLAGWLFQTTRFVASRALRTELRRQRREQESLMMQQLSQTDETWKRLAPELDEALATLGEGDRNALLLRFFQEKTCKETGAALSISEEAAKKRISRAVDKLRDLLRGRGVHISATALGTVIATEAVKAAPAELALSVSSSALACVAQATVGLPMLVRETLAAWRWATLKWTAALATGALLLLFLLGSRGLWKQQPAPASVSSQSATQTVATLSTAPKPSVNAATKPRSTTGLLRLHVVAADTGEGVPRAGLIVDSFTETELKQNHDLATDESGWAEIPYPPEAAALMVGVIASGWTARCVNWTPYQDDRIPAEYILKVDRLTNWFGGWLRDENDQPVAGAEVTMTSQNSGDHANRERPRERVGVPPSGAVVARSDQKGWWSCSIVPRANNGGFQLAAKHPDFRETDIASQSRDDGETDKQRDQLELLWRGQLVTRLDRGLTLAGRVLTPEGKPIAQAEIAHNPDFSDGLVIKADAEGAFAFHHRAAGQFAITTTSPGFAPDYRDVNLQVGMSPVEIKLRPGAILRLRTVDQNGESVPGTTVGLEEWGENRHVLKWSAESDLEGRIEWNSAPPGGQLELYAKKSDWCYSRQIHLVADGTEHLIKMRPALTVTGTVRDGVTGELVRTAKAFPGYGSGQSAWERLATRYGADGSFKVVFEENTNPWRVRIEAEGYEPWISEPISAESAQPLDVAMRPINSRGEISGTILDANGRPAAEVQVALLTLEHDVMLDRSRFVRSGEDQLIVETDAGGRFSFGRDSTAHSIAAVSAAGFARMRVRDFTRPVTLQLQPWARIEGFVRAVNLPDTAHVVLQDRAAIQYKGHVSFDHRNFRVPPGSDGRFVIEGVPPGRHDLYLDPKIGKPYTDWTPVETFPGKTTEVQIGGKGRNIIGRLKPDPSQRSRVSYSSLRIPNERLERPKGLSAEGGDIWDLDFWQSPAGRAYLDHNVSYGLNVAADGSFTISSVAPGTYLLEARISGFSRAQREVIVPDSEEADSTPIDLGLIEGEARASARK